MTNQLASLEQRDYFYLDPFSSVNLGTYIINIDYFMVGERVRFLFTSCEESQTHSFAALTRSFAILHNK